MAQEPESERNASGIARTSKRKWGYDSEQVDAFLERAHMLYEGEGAQLTQHDIQNVSFDLVKGGYVIAQVDAALARLERAVVDKQTTWEISQHGRVAWKAQTESLFRQLDAHSKREHGERFKPGEGKEPSYDRKQVDRIVDQCLTKAAGELGVEEVSEDDAKKLVDLNSQTVANVIFTQRKGKRGYDERQVDYYLNECVQLLTRLESYARVADFVGEPSESAMTAANPSATSLASQETQVVSPLFAVPAVSAEPIAQPAQVQNSTDSFDALNKAEREIFTTPATSPVSIPVAQAAAPTHAPVVPPVFQPTISTPPAPVTPAAPVTSEPQAAPVAPAAPEQSLAHLFTASNTVAEEPSSVGTETEAFNPLSDDGEPSYDAPAAPAAPVIPDTPVAHQPEESHGITIAPDSSLAALAQMAQNIDAPDPVEDTFTPRSIILAWYGHAHDIAAGCGQFRDLLQCRGNIGCQRIGHGLHRDWRSPTDWNGTDHNTVRFAARMQRAFANGCLTGFTERLFDFWHTSNPCNNKAPDLGSLASLTFRLFVLFRFPLLVYQVVGSTTGFQLELAHFLHGSE